MTGDCDRGGKLLGRRFVLAGVLAGLAVPAWAEAPGRSLRPQPRPPLSGRTALAASKTPDALAQSAEALIDAARLGGRVSYAVFDARSGALLEGRADAAGQPPASVAKAITSLYALDRLGRDFRFVTRVLATGPVQGGMVQGDLILLGSGDPTLDTDMLGDLAAALRAKGVRGVRGRFLVNAAALPQIDQIDPDQPEHVGYNPAISGLNLNFNRVHFEWKRAGAGWQVGMDARGSRFVPAVRMASARIVERQSPLFTYERGKGQERWTVASASLGKGGSRWLPVRAPELYAGEVFRTLCDAQGIALPDPQAVGGQPAGTVLAQVVSPPLPDMLRAMLRHSTNLTAETLGLTASGAGSLRESARRMSDWLRATHGVEADFVDHSGLGGGSRISAAAMAGALMRVPQLADLMRPFPTRSKGKGEGPRVQAKTGTLNFVSGLAGYVAGPKPLVFAIFAADTARRDRLRGAERERPAGGPEWTRRARAMQGQLIERWAALYGG
ncbi:MAG: D-alanyl-D-alanine carboxypeptidase/D-alanyl-D-alanine-endopeptidase [Rhodobacterales bacterium]|nr:D-alanyl-D-alanine carboxypeptidase/D-alanyl-D-alanine-endopeptidase [Rhodobacterales bacterium]MDX5500142.1 D-alanyl-D-alanine carboxypeptidase/D-alanyl-D-alanine-endopeptidase [Rhodobacterales bacterium]